MYFTLVIVAFTFYGLIYATGKNTLVYQNRDRIYLITWFLLAAMIMGLRSVNVGVDTLSYANHFKIISAASWSEIFGNLRFIKYNSFEIGYVCLAKLCSILVNSYSFLQFVLSFIFCFAMLSFLNENVKSKIILTTVFLGSGLYLMAFNINRQMIAVALAALSWNYLCKGKNAKAIIMLFLASTFHLTAFVFVIAYIFYIIRKRKILFGTAIVIGVIAAINYKSVISVAQRYLGSEYTNYWGNIKTKQTIGLSIIIFIIVLLLAMYVLFQKNKFSAIEKVYAVFSAIYVICNFIGLYFNYFERIGIYFLPFVILEIDAIAQKIKSKDIHKLYVSGVTICYSLYFLVSSSTTQYVYQFLWSN